MSKIQFYSDSSCSELIGETIGPNDGLCTAFGKPDFTSFRVVSLEQTCVVTVYRGDVNWCSSSNLSVATFAYCYTGVDVNQFSVDCMDIAVASSAIPSTVTDAPTATSSTASQTSSALSSPTTSLSLTTSEVRTTNAGGTVTVVSTVVSTPTNSLSSSAPNANVNEGLSTGTKAGIGAGVALAVILLICGLIFFVLRKKRRSNTAKDTSGEKHGAPMPISGLGQGKTADDTTWIPDYRHGMSAQAKGTHPTELPARDRSSFIELPGNHHRDPQEMDASPADWRR